jgi:membrane peptidoglycan carboxypeptidase
MAPELLYGKRTAGTLSMLQASLTELPDTRSGQEVAAVPHVRPAPHRHARRGKAVRRALGSILLVVMAALAIVAWAWQATPSTSGLAAWVRAQDAMRNAPYTPLSAISPAVLRALVAIEDEHFYQHHGIDTIGLARAAWDDMKAGRLVEGGSTITAQLAKNAYLGGSDRTIPRKLEDLVLAAKLERRYDKRQILEMYLNLAYYGEGAYGIGAASERYFGVSPAHLDVAEAALLAGLVQAPGYNDPWCHPDQARARQGQVLARMRADGYITGAQARAASGETFSFWQSGAGIPHDAYCPA